MEGKRAPESCCRYDAAGAKLRWMSSTKVRELIGKSTIVEFRNSFRRGTFRNIKSSRRLTGSASDEKQRLLGYQLGTILDGQLN